ncbi:rhodanese-like domain-containing protein [Pseudalkalibacillus sp. R45]|uniref:rhodanese-like domain-containing protein n=1 Tax=Pseudalkalibacillus sp. R45 TaxID=3457433 RepID=UPI003FCE01D6
MFGFNNVKTITPDEVDKKRKENNDISIIDVREDEEVANGIIPGAKHIPLGDISERTNEIPKDKEHIMVCRSGNRSGKAAKFLEGEGYSVLNMKGGMMNWNGELSNH